MSDYVRPVGDPIEDTEGDPDIIIGVDHGYVTIHVGRWESGGGIALDPGRAEDFLALFGAALRESGRDAERMRADSDVALEWAGQKDWEDRDALAKLRALKFELDSVKRAGGAIDPLAVGRQVEHALNRAKRVAMSNLDRHFLRVYTRTGRILHYSFKPPAHDPHRAMSVLCRRVSWWKARAVEGVPPTSPPGSVFIKFDPDRADRLPVCKVCAERKAAMS